MTHIARSFALCLAGATSALLAPAPSTATVMPRLSLRDLVGSAQRIFIGTALRAKSRWTDDGRFIVTDTVVRIDQSLDGAAASGGTVIVSELGGSVDGIGLRVAGSTELPLGQQVLLFAQGASTGPLRVVGMRQGAYLLARDAQGRTLAQRRLAGLELRPLAAPGAAERTTGPRDPTGSIGAPNTIFLDELVAQVRETISACATTTDRCRPVWIRPTAAK